MNIEKQICLCIPTYKRPHLLSLLIDDLTKQTVEPHIIVVDGNWRSGQVINELKQFNGIPITYIPSNHSNLAYQRYLGWRIADPIGRNFILYLDDDIRICQPDAIEKLLAPLNNDSEVVGATAVIRFGDTSEIYKNHPILAERTRSQPPSLLLRTFGASQKYRPGQLTPSGERIAVKFCGNQHEPVEWLRGGVMAYRMKALTQDCFSADLFAMTEVKYGKGEDTFLSRQVMRHGQLVYVFDAVFEHPNSDLPKTYPIDAYRLAFATAYSRRFLNEHYRPNGKPTFGDRLSLLKTYLGNIILTWWKAFRAPAWHRFSYAWGYTAGAALGLVRKPTAHNLTPKIDWWADAELALLDAQEIVSKE